MSRCKNDGMALALAHLDSATDLNHELRDPVLDSFMTTCRGLVAQAQGDYDSAQHHYAAALRLAQTQPTQRDVPAILERFAALAAAQQQGQRAAQLFGAAAHLRTLLLPTAQWAFLRPMSAGDAAPHTQYQTATFAAAWREGEMLSLNAACRLALTPPAATALTTVNAPHYCR